MRVSISGGGVVAAVAACLMAASGAAQAQDQTVTLVVPFTAGGPADTIARLIAPGMAADLGVPVIVRNDPGGGGTIGAARVADSAPDGHTLLLHNLGMATSPSLYANLPYDPVSSFAAIGLVTTAPMTIVARPDFPATTLAEMQEAVQQAAAEGEVYTIAHAGIGSASQLCAILLMDLLDLPLQPVGYDGTRPALDDLTEGAADLLCDQATNTRDAISVGSVTAFALTSRTRLPTLPSLPTTAEAGFPEVDVEAWHGLWAPADTPDDTVLALSEALQAVVSDPDIIARLAAIGTTAYLPEAATPGALNAHLGAEIARWRPIARLAAAGG